MPADVSATFARRPDLVLVVTNNGPGDSQNVRAEMVEPPPAMPKLVQAPGAPGRNVAASQSFELPVVTPVAEESKQTARLRLTWEDDTGERLEVLTLTLPS